ncbi:hypothetical protein CGZ90_02315 [Fictibacillus aquaticus]|jgi:hypothetical protein|uniref:Uncharacterized protein n=1 Tax=Fictibacillus aquaticus TaxID=2021314 RepID=A0A235FD83_9BACL|nr:hypothetical protein CGZ90_02315 [Fictibacillus aquaticus]
MSRSGEGAHRLPRGKRAPETEINLCFDFFNSNTFLREQSFKRQTRKIQKVFQCPPEMEAFLIEKRKLSLMNLF